MIDLDELEALAKAAGGDEWTPTYATRTDLAAVWLPDGDALCRCYGNIGHLPDPIDADDVAEFIAAANPATILALIAEVRAWRQHEISFQMWMDSDAEDESPEDIALHDRYETSLQVRKQYRDAAIEVARKEKV